MSQEQGKEEVPAVVHKDYNLAFKLKYGCNPHQQPSNIRSIGDKLPFVVRNGTPGYINLLDALNSWQLVKELRQSLNLPAAASFKHVSPAGAGIAVPLSDVEKEVYGIDQELTGLALAYVRARNADPKCSYGDFAAMSDVVDEKTALFLKSEVSDGIIAPGYEPKALEILKQKKQGAFVVIEIDPNYNPPSLEYREVYGIVFEQKRNDVSITKDTLADIKTKNKDIPDKNAIDLILAQIVIKYTQSNSVGYAINGQMIGIGAGQQSRVDCCELAGKKVATWYLRQHPKVRGLKFKENVKKTERTNARVYYIQGEFTDYEKQAFDALFTEVPSPLTEKEKKDFLSTLKGVSCSSDAFFPFRDSVDVLVKYGTSYIVQAGGSIQDDSVIDACDQYGVVMAFSKLRLFHH